MFALQSTKYIITIIGLYCEQVYKYKKQIQLYTPHLRDILIYNYFCGNVGKNFINVEKL